MLLKTETQQTFVNGLLGFITLGIYTRRATGVLLTIIVWVAHRYGQLYLHCSLIYFWVPSSCLHSDQPSEGEIIPFSGVCQSGEAALSTPEAVGQCTDWQTVWCNRRRPAATSSRRASFSALASANPSHFTQRNITLTHLHVSNCRVRQLQFSGIFVALGFVGNGVITVMINSLWQADDDADNQSGRESRWLCLIHQLRLFRPLLWILQSGRQPYARTGTITSARQWSPDIKVTVDAWRISTTSSR